MAVAETTRRRRKRVAVAKDAPIINDAPRTFTEAELEIGQVAHQGDLILVRIACLPKSAKPRKNRQLAEGNTQGSRHVLESGNVFDCSAGEAVTAIAAVCRGVNVGEQYVGPVFQSVDGVANLVHPEHGDHLYRGEMTIACVFQRNLDAEEREQRTQD